MRIGSKPLAVARYALMATLLLAGCRGSSPALEGEGVYGTDTSTPASTSTTTAAARPIVTSSTTEPPGKTSPLPVEPEGGVGPSASVLRSTSTTAPRSICLGLDSAQPNAAPRKDPTGLFLRLVVADRLCFGPRDGITLELGVKNVSNTDIYYDSNRYDAFAIEPSGGAAGPRWSEFSCVTPSPSGTPGPALVLEPGESLRFTARYPEQPTQNRSSSPCHVLEPGDYTVRSFFRTCPEGSRDRGYCDLERVVDVPSATLDIRVMAEEAP